MSGLADGIVPHELPPARLRMKTSTRIVLACWAAGLVYAILRHRLVIPFWGCPLKELTGIPCPTCGGTRALAALARLDLKEALLCNPLVTVVWLMMPAATILMELKPRLWQATLARFGLPAIMVAGVAALLMNWILLIMLSHV